MADSNEIDDILNELKSKGTDGENPPESADEDLKDDASAGQTEKIDDGSEDLTEHSNGELTQDDGIDEQFTVTEQVAERAMPDLSGYDSEYSESEQSGRAVTGRRKTVIAVISVIVIIAVAAAVFFAVYKNRQKEHETTEPTTKITTTAAPVVYRNPLTNTDGYNQSAASKRPVALVVENAYTARPQWGIDDEKNPPDIIIDGEVEGGETRMLWIYADYTSLPEQVGPMRSARPPFIKFSQLFDAVFIHWGQSSSKGDYVGADTVFAQDNVDHINQMTFNDKAGLFGRDKTRGVSTEHTGVLYGSKLAESIEAAGFRTEADKSSYMQFSFNDSEKALGTAACGTMSVKLSSMTAAKSWSYNSEDKCYHTDAYGTDVSRKNLLVLFDTTEYVVKYNYGGSGRAETYCNYSLAGGSGKLAGLGTVTDIVWSVENGQLKIKDAAGNEVKLNTGTTWIGYASSNNGGAVSAQ